MSRWIRRRDLTQGQHDVIDAEQSKKNGAARVSGGRGTRLGDEQALDAEPGLRLGLDRSSMADAGSDRIQRWA